MVPSASRLRIGWTVPLVARVVFVFGDYWAAGCAVLGSWGPGARRLSSKGCSRNYPQGVGCIFFFRPLHPQDTHGVGVPQPSGHVSALINPRPLWIKYALTPGQVTPPRTRQQNTLPPQDKKVPVAHPPPRIISGTALRDAIPAIRNISLLQCIIIEWCQLASPLSWEHKNKVLVCTGHLHSYSSG